METGILDEVLLHRGGDGGHIADVFHHGGQSDGGHDQDRCHVELGQDEGLEAHHLCRGHPGEVHLLRGQSRRIGHQHAQEDGDDLDHALAPDVGGDDDGHSQDGQPPVGGGVIDGAGGQGQPDQDDDRAGDHRREEAHHLVYPHQLDQPGQGQIQQAGHHDPAQGVRQLLFPGHAGVDAGVQLCHGGESAQVGEGGAQEGGDPQLGAYMEEQGADPGEEQGGLDGQGQSIALYQDGHQDGGPEHSEHVLQSEDQHLGQAQLAGVADRSIVVHMVLLSLTRPYKRMAIKKRSQT